MNGLEIGIAVGAALIVAASVVLAIIRKKKGKTACGCEIKGKNSVCGDCGGCDKCPSAKTEPGTDINA
ncbi:MAG: hypothetical protein LBT55_04675 [Clostridiaceae bacterium]|jgi:hypothetical protein|nr:hypothetical protein [Clostridiaceae bacterium]